MAKMLLLGASAGILSGMFGIGGGLVIVPALIVVCGLDPKSAVGTSLFALLLPTGLLGVLEYWRRGELRPIPGLLVALGLFCGAYFGARVTGALSTSAMKRVYAAFLILVAIYFLWTSTPGGTEGPEKHPGPLPQALDGDQESASHPVH
jgi:uncharacterized membrane protein YfcA